MSEQPSMMLRHRVSSFLYSGNAPYVEDQYEQYLADPSDVTAEWKAYFDALRTTPAVDGSATQDELLAFARKQAAVESLVHAYRMVGTRKARLDPLQWTPTPEIAELAPGFHGLTARDASLAFGTDTGFWTGTATLGDLWVALEQTYCGTLGSEFMHLTDTTQRRWWRDRLESTRATPTFAEATKKRILQKLVAAEGLEKYLQTRYVGQTRFSLEGGESLIVLLDELVQSAATHAIGSVVIGMAHRGRLNVLVNVAGKPPRALFDEFEGLDDRDLLAGDVKYHKGYAGQTRTDSGSVGVQVAFNASHLEMINPVVQGIARGLAEKDDVPDGKVLPVEVHGDAAITGQGIVMETLSLTYTRGHGTGGTVHVVVNNQVGFTTSDPRDTRSSFYCTDIAKMIEAPVLHVNGDDPEAVALAAQMAIDYRATFRRSVVIELVCFRRYGHQEQDTPDMTQPLMYRAIARHPGLKTLYAQKLVREGVLTEAEVVELARSHRGELEAARLASGRRLDSDDATPHETHETRGAGAVDALSLADLRALAARITEVPPEIKLHPLVAKVMDGRREMASGKRPLDWGMGEHLAYASLLAAGIDVRLSGQDSERGTFGHRHAVLHDQNRARRGDGTYLPLTHIGPDQGRFRVTNSILSEAGVLAFEYGYSITRPEALVLWEAQFGDFANGAQVVIDQFLSAADAKWGQKSSLVMLLPHGQEGQGPEHASARLERFLQLCAQHNLHVCQPTRAAQFFHLLRRQATGVHDRRPLIVMTPKSLLRHPGAASTLEELAYGAFQPVLADAEFTAADAHDVDRVILCSGKVYYDLLDRRRKTGSKAGSKAAAIVRLEQLYPFPAATLQAELGRCDNLKVVVWCQEEAANQGAWRAIESQLRSTTPPAAVLRYAGRPAMASTAPGHAREHAEQQAALVDAAFDA